MRVIAGKARRLPLKSIEGLDTRPTTDRIKETLFNMLQDELYHCRFLDLFAGSGGIGIEALSRGAKEAVFVEQNRKAAACIQENLKFTKLEGQAKVINRDVMSSLGGLEQGEPFHIIFMDPPYNHLWEKQVLERLAHSTMLDENTILIVEASLDTDFSYLSELNYEILKRKEYKTNTHMFLRRREE